MDTVNTMLTIILLTGFIRTIWLITDDNNYSAVGGFIGLIVFVLSIIGLLAYNNQPSAIDVYEGKTELKRTVVGNEVVDSTVVWRKNHGDK